MTKEQDRAPHIATMRNYECYETSEPVIVKSVFHYDVPKDDIRAMGYVFYDEHLKYDFDEDFFKYEGEWYTLDGASIEHYEYIHDSVKHIPFPLYECYYTVHVNTYPNKDITQWLMVRRYDENHLEVVKYTHNRSKEASC